MQPKPSQQSAESSQPSLAKLQRGGAQTPPSQLSPQQSPSASHGMSSARQPVRHVPPRQTSPRQQAPSLSHGSERGTHSHRAFAQECEQQALSESHALFAALHSGGFDFELLSPSLPQASKIASDSAEKTKHRTTREQWFPTLPIAFLLYDVRFYARRRFRDRCADDVI
jgi:hypothetical protein